MFLGAETQIVCCVALTLGGNGSGIAEGGDF